MTDIQLLKTPDGRHPYLSRWSRSEPASVIFNGNGDHWAKLKHKAAVLTLRYGDGNTGVAFWMDGEPYNYIRDNDRVRKQLLQREQQQNHRRLSSVGRKPFNESMIEGLDGDKPGHYLPYKETRNDLLRTSANARAREGFRYWVLDKPVRQGSKYTTGARTTFLGLGKSFYP